MFFETNLLTGEGDKLEVKDSVAIGTNLVVDIYNVAKTIALGKDVVFIDLPSGTSSNLTLSSLDGEDFIDLDPIRADLKIDNNKFMVSTPRLPVVPEPPPVVPEIKEPEPLPVEPPIINQKQYASNLSNAAVSEFTSRVNLLKNQKQLLEKRINLLDGNLYTEGAYYLGNYTDLKYGSKNFRDYKQEIRSHGLGLGKLYSKSGYRVLPVFDIELFDLPANNYRLTDRHNDSYAIYSKKETLLSFKPSLTLEKLFKADKFDLIPSLTVGYEINKYLRNEKPEINIEGIKFIAPMPEKGYEIKIGNTIKFKENFNVGIEGKYLTGEEVK